MTTNEIGQKLVELCKAGKNAEAMQTLYATDIVSVEAVPRPGHPAETTGLEACLAKGKAFAEDAEVHSAKVEGPFPNGDRFAVIFDYDMTRRSLGGKRFRSHEVALYTVKNDKIIREEFFYNR